MLVFYYGLVLCIVGYHEPIYNRSVYRYIYTCNYINLMFDYIFYSDNIDSGKDTATLAVFEIYYRNGVISSWLESCHYSVLPW